MINKMRARHLLLVAVLSGLVAPAFGQSGWTSGSPAPDPDEGPASIPVGPFKLFPGLDVGLGNNDNLYSSNVNRRSAWYSTVSPYARLEGKTGPHTFDITGRLEDAHYSKSGADDYLDWSLLGNADIQFSSRARLRARAEARHGHDPRGSTDRGVSSR